MHSPPFLKRHPYDFIRFFKKPNQSLHGTFLAVHNSAKPIKGLLTFALVSSRLRVWVRAEANEDQTAERQSTELVEG
jgi:hypothetical protein